MAGLSISDSENHFWIHLLQYEKNIFSGWTAQNLNNFAFLDPNGVNDPMAELQATFALFQGADRPYSKTDQTLKCVFQGRKYFLKNILKLPFPEPECEDFEKWKNAIDLNELRIVFAGPYMNNPASMMGHVFFRMAHPEKEKSRPGIDLLSYTAGYMASVNPDDSILTYTVNGLFGGYPGFFQIAPHYQNAGIYNYAEDRDLWEYSLNLNSEELELFLAILWESSWTEATPYYFFSKNCAYRPIEILEIIRPSSRLLKQFKNFVLPLDAVRLLNDSGFIKVNSSNYRPAQSQRLHLLTSNMSFKQKVKYWNEKSDKDVLVLDALLLKYSLLNHKKKTLLNQDEKRKYQELLSERSRLAVASPELSHEKLKGMTTGSPIEGHRSSWWAWQMSYLDDRWQPSIEYRMGAHGASSPLIGNKEGSSIEYLGLKLGSQLDVLFFNIENLNELDLNNLWPSWRLSSRWLDLTRTGVLDSRVGIGLTFFRFFILGELEVLNHTRFLSEQAETYLQPTMGYDLQFKKVNLRFESRKQKVSARASYSWAQDLNLILQKSETEFNLDMQFYF